MPPEKAVKGSRLSRAPIRNVGSGNKPWMLDLRYLGGKREFYATEDEAKSVRESKLNEVKKHGTSALSLSHADRVAFVVAKERLDKIGLTIEGAVQFVEKHYRRSEAKEFSAAVTELYDLKLATNKRERSAEQFRYSLESLGASVGDRLVSEIQREEIEKWLFGNGWAPATIRTKLIDVRTFFRAALKRGWLAVDPTEAIESVELDDKPPGILTVEQCKRLLNAAREVAPEFVGFIALGLFAGIRPEEIEGMQPGDVQIARGHAEVRAEVAKSRQRRLVDLPENCRAWLKIGLDLPPTNPRGRMNKVRLRAGFEGFRKKLVAGREKWIKVAGEEWPHDCMRHSFGSYHLAMHGSADKTAVQMGHRSTDMLFRHYRELVTKEDAKKFWGIRP